jgi:seryl-tRNA synthetase
LLDINFVRSFPAKVKADLEKRGQKEKIALVDSLIEADRQWREHKQRLDDLRSKRNTLSKQIQEKLSINEKPSELIEEAKELPAKIKKAEEVESALQKKICEHLRQLPNTLHESVPAGSSDADNVIIKKHGKPIKPKFELRHHGELASALGLADFERAARISGTGFYFLKNELALADIALQLFAIDLLRKKGFVPVLPPFLMKHAPYEAVADLETFREQLYTADDGIHLIATSEHALAAMHGNEIIVEENLPLKYCGISPCFRREVGRHSIDERGLFRVHQFNKIEQFVFCAPEQSWKFMEQLSSNAQLLLQKLKIPYTVTNVCTGDIGSIAAKKYDINGWSPREGKYIELMSCSNCTDYQARSLNIRLRRKNGEKETVHTLNSTMVATTRMLRLIIEHYQTKDAAIKVPAALRKYMQGIKEIAPKKAKKR